MLETLSRLGLARGLLGGSRAWTMVGGLAFAVRLLKRLGGGDKVVYRHELKPGESLLISHDRRVTVRGDATAAR